MALNNFLPFCPTDSGTNLLTQVEYAAATDRTNGNQPGVASSKLNNKAIRQSTFVTGQVAQLLVDTLGVDVLDNGVGATLLAQLKAALLPVSPITQKFLSSSGTWNKTYCFTITSGSATTGATYTNNSVTYTVVSTVASATQVYMTGSGAPLVSGTLTKTGGTGDSTLTFQAYRAPLYLRVRAVGGGGGGGGSGTTDGTAATAGTDTTFGVTIVSAGGGSIGSRNGNGGAGGTASVTSAATGITTNGTPGGPSATSGTSPVTTIAGGVGGSSALGGGGRGASASSTAGGTAATNSGGGGGGAGTGTTSNVNSGSGGGSGAYVDAIIAAPAATYAYQVGAGGSGQGAGTAGSAGGAGAAGLLVVTEYYQ